MPNYELDKRITEAEGVGGARTTPLLTDDDSTVGDMQ